MKNRIFVYVFILIVLTLFNTSCDIFEEVRTEKAKALIFREKIHEEEISDHTPEEKIHAFSKLIVEINTSVKSDKFKTDLIVLCYSYKNTYNFRLGRLQKVVDSSDALLRQYPGVLGAYYSRGYAYQLQGNYGWAILDYNKILKTEASSVQTLNNRAFSHMKVGNFQAAKNDYNKIISLGVRSSDVYNNLANAYSGQGDFDNAIANYNKSLELDSAYTEVYFNRGDALYASERYADAVSSYDMALAADSTYIAAYINKGNTYIELKDYDKALNCYSQAIILDAQSPDLYYNMALTYEKLEDKKKAISCYDKVIKLDSNNELGLKEFAEAKIEGLHSSKR